MPAKRRYLRILLIALAVVLFTGWFAFRTFLFDPLEKDYPHDLSLLVPRGVDFYASKADLSRDVGPELRPRIASALEASPGGRALLALPPVADLLARVSLDEVRAEVRAALDQLPVAVDPLSVFGGRDLAIAGRFGGDLEATDWAVYGRANWMGKLAVALLDHPGVAGLDARGFRVRPSVGADGERFGHELSGGGLARPLVVARLRDVVVVGTTSDLVGRVPVLDRTRGEDSFGLSAKYHDHVARDRARDDELELYVDARALQEALGRGGRWPDPRSGDFATALAGRIFQIGSVREAIGTVAFGRVTALRAHAALSSELMTPFQRKLYKKRGLDTRQVLSGDAARLAPADSALFVEGTLELADLLREAFAVVPDAALISNLEDHVRSVWGYGTVEPLIADLDAAFGDRFALVVRPNDYPDDPEGPPHDDMVVPAWALVLWVEDESKVEEIRAKIVNNQHMFGIQGSEPGSRGVYENVVAGGFRIYEYWIPLVRGTGHLASVTADFGASGKVVVLSNHYRMLGDMTSGYYGHGLDDEPSFAAQVGAGLPSSDVLLWARPRNLSGTLRDMARLWARDSVWIDWSVERPRILREVARQRFPGRSLDSLSETETAELERAAQPELDRFEAEARSRDAGSARRDLERRIDALEAAEFLLLQLSLDPKSIELAARVKVPLEGDPQP